MLGLLTPIFGLLGSAIPSIIKIFEKKQDAKHELELYKLQLEAGKDKSRHEVLATMVRAEVDDRISVRLHDSSLDGGKFINALRASIRPTITYSFFLLFVAIKIAALKIMLDNGIDGIIILERIWNDETMALFSTILAFWFGSRVIEKRSLLAPPTPPSREEKKQESKPDKPAETIIDRRRRRRNER